jgi:hypothetical protein
MPRLPQPGSDAGNWGNLLNDFLSTTHDSNGNLKAGSVTSGTIATDSVTLAKLAIGNAPTSGQVLSFDGSGLSWAASSSTSTVADATTTTKGVIQLAGDLGGTSAAPIVPGLALKANASDVVNLTGAQTVGGAKNFTGGLQSGGATVVIASDTRLTDARTPIDASVSTAKIADNSVTEPKLSVSNLPATGQMLSYNGTTLAWATPAGDPALGGDLSGTASAAQIIANAVTTAKIADNSVTEPKLSADNVPISGQLLSFNGTNFTWVAQPSGTATDPTMGGDLTGTASTAQIIANAVTTAKIADNSVTEPKLSVSNLPATGQMLSYNGTTLAWATPAGDPALGGDLSGTASAAQIVASAVGANELATNAVTTVKITDANVTTAKLADNSVTEPKLSVSNVPATGQVLSYNGTALAWATPATGGGSTWTAVVKSAAYTAVSSNFVICDTTTSGFTVTLPAPANGAYVTVKKLTNNTNAVLVAPPSGSIDAGSATSTTIAVNSYGQVVDFIADGTTWHQVG